MDQALNNADHQYHDTAGRLSAQDKEMMTQVSMWSCNRQIESSTARTSPTKTNLSVTPKDTSFMTEENLKKIYMPKKIEF